VISGFLLDYYFMKEKGLIPISVVLGLAVLLLGAGFYFYTQEKPKTTNSPSKACTEEARQCPDGSYVSRNGPNCEFSACPIVSGVGNLKVVQDKEATSSSWKSFSNAYYSLQYPADWSVRESEKDLDLRKPDAKINIIISEGQEIYGYEASMKTKTTEIKVKVGGKEYPAEETVINDKTVVVDLGLKDAKDHHILFGNDYPTSVRGGTLEGYNQNKETILKILSTLEFKQAF
jgi:hypothetical protein